MSKYLGNSIFCKLLLTFVLITIPLYSISTVVYYISQNTVRKEIENSMMVRSSFFLNNIDSELMRIKTLQNDCLSDRDLNDLANLSYMMSIFEKTNCMLRLQHRMNAIKNSSSYIEEVTVHVPSIGKSISAWEGITKLYINDYDNLVNSLNGVLRLIYHNQGLRMLSTLPVIGKEGQRPLFILDIKLSEEQIIKSLQYNDKDKPGKTVLIDLSNHYVINGNRNEKLLEKIVNWISNANINSSSGKEYVKLGPKKYFLVFSKSSYTNFVTLSYIPEEEIIKGLRKIRIWFWLLPFAAILTILAYSLSIAKIVQNPLRKLIESFSAVKEGKLNYKINYVHNDEFKNLYNCFNDMVQELNRLIEQVYKQKILAQKAEMKQLQSQINPHFLYNSFYILNTMAVLGDNENIEKFTVQLGDYFKFITKNTMDDVRLEEEVRHARIYTEIQAMRFANRVKVHFDELPYKLYDIMVPRLIIQPLIENAFEHGLEKKMKDGILSIQFQQEDDRVDIIIEDNGNGLDHIMLNELNRRLGGEPSTEVTGIVNIHRRLVLKFGRGSGVIISNGKFGGAKAVLRIIVGRDD